LSVGDLFRSFLGDRRSLESPLAADDMIPASELAALVDEGLRTVLEPAGFLMVSPMRWIRARESWRDIVEYRATKGAGYEAAWGISLDVVPRITGPGLKWKRTDRSAQVDLRLERISGVDHRRLGASRLPASQGNLKSGAFRQRAETAGQAAINDLGALETLADISRAFDRWDKVDPNFRIYDQPYLAKALISQSLGDGQKTEGLLATFCDRCKVSRGDPLLLKALAEAAGTGL